MNGFGQHSLNQATDGFNPFAIVMLYIGEIRRKWSLGVLLTKKISGPAADPHTETQYVVTEYGAVNLHGKSTAERTMALISIAHPDFRGQLLQEAKAMGYV